MRVVQESCKCILTDPKCSSSVHSISAAVDWKSRSNCGRALQRIPNPHVSSFLGASPRASVHGKKYVAANVRTINDWASVIKLGRCGWKSIAVLISPIHTIRKST